MDRIAHQPDGSENLHSLLRKWHMVSDDLLDFEERLDFLIQTTEDYQESSQDQMGRATVEKLKYLRSRNHIWKRWVDSYRERTNILMSLYFDIATRNDNTTNLKIAYLTGKIAKETRRDSSAMIT